MYILFTRDYGGMVFTGRAVELKLIHSIVFFDTCVRFLVFSMLGCFTWRERYERVKYCPLCCVVTHALTVSFFTLPSSEYPVCTCAYDCLCVQHLTEKTEMQVVGGVLSPAHDMAVRGVCRRFLSQCIPSRHRTAMAELAVEGSSWLTVRRWEITRRNVMDYRSVLKNVQQASTLGVVQR
jgi:hypothetical protein